MITKTEKMIEAMDEMMNDVLKEFVDVNLIADACDVDGSDNALKYVPNIFKLYKLSKELLVEQATIMDDMNKKLDLLLEKTK